MASSFLCSAWDSVAWLGSLCKERVSASSQRAPRGDSRSLTGTAQGSRKSLRSHHLQ